MTSKVPYWIHKRDQASSDRAHMQYEGRLHDRIKELEKENSELKQKIEKTENAFFIALDLLLKTPYST